jgi:hypothetical protein
MDLDVEDEEEPRQVISAVPSGLPYGDVDLFSPAKGMSDNDDWWSRAEERFDDLPVVDRQSMPAKESIIAWKVCCPPPLGFRRDTDDQELQLCTYSFTPQLKVQLGKVVEVSSERMVVRRLERYDADEDDPFNGQPAEMVVEGKDWDAVKGTYRYIADPVVV